MRIFTLDLETTGVNVKEDKIVQIAGEFFDTETGEIDAKVRLINPERPIPADATEVHKITDAVVADQPTFRRVAKSLIEWIGDSALVGYNIRRFDLPLLMRELKESGHELPMEGRMVIDTMVLYHFHQPRGLLQAVELYLGKKAADAFEKNAHDAMADVQATRDVLLGMQGHSFFTEGGHDKLEVMNDICDQQRPLELTPWEEWFKGSDPPRFQFGKHKGTLLTDAPGGYIDWMIGQAQDSHFHQLVNETRWTKPPTKERPDEPDPTPPPATDPTLFD